MRRGPFIGFFFALAIVLFLRGTAGADIINGSVELFHQKGDSKTTDATGLTSETKTTNFLQRYFLNYDSLLTPYLDLRVGMRVDKQVVNQEADGFQQKFKSTVLMPSTALTLRSPFVYAGIGYDKRDERLEAGGEKQTMIRETTNAFLGFKPEGLPTLDLQAFQRSTYDKERLSKDVDETALSLYSTYRPVKSLEFSYRAVSSDQEDHKSQSETKGLTQNGRVSYSDQFLDNRAMLHASYNATRLDTQTTRNSVGGVTRLQLFPVAGLSSINDTPLLGALDQNPALIDGIVTAGSGINIGQLPSQGGDTRKRNVGVDFGAQNDVSALSVWVDRQLPAVVSNSYVWEIYTSPDNQNWNLHETIFPAAFDPFDNRFELNFAGVRTRYIKAVTRPLSVAVVPPPGTDVSNIFITEVQTFIDKAVIASAGSSVNDVAKSDFFDLNGKFYLLRRELYTLYYDLYYKNTDFERSGAASTQDTIVINSLVLNGRLSRVWTGSAKVLQENDDTTSGTGKTTSRLNDYTASLAATVESLRKLSHNLVMTVRREDRDNSAAIDTLRDTGTAYLTNNAEVYPGVNATLGLGKNLVSEETGSAHIRTDGSLFNMGADINPHRTVLISATYSWTKNVQEGSGNAPFQGTISRMSRVSGANVTYTPFPTLYLFGSLYRTQETGQPTRTTQYFSGSYTFRQTGGALELRIIYTQDDQADTDTVNRTYGPYARWRINYRTYLECSYLITLSKSPSQRTDGNTLNTSFKWYF